MSNFIYNSYCVVHPGAEQISLTADYHPAQEADAAVAARDADFSFICSMVAVLALLAGLALAGESNTALVGTLLWVLALAGWALSLSSVRRGLVTLRQGLRAWQNSRRMAAEDERTWKMALHDARLMADLARAMDRQER
ncbi:MAG: hypothetical protein RR855_00665 [Comamonas sp.]